VKQPNPENEQLLESPRSEAGFATPSLEEVTKEDDRIIAAFQQELSKENSALYCEYIRENGHTTGITVKRYQQPQNPSCRPSPEDEIVWFEHLDAIKKSSEDNRSIAALLRDYRTSKDAQASH
jgi:hypothetical protein